LEDLSLSIEEIRENSSENLINLKQLGIQFITTDRKIFILPYSAELIAFEESQFAGLENLATLRVLIFLENFDYFKKTILSSSLKKLKTFNVVEGATVQERQFRYFLF
jgi:hypothetical protein